MPIKNSYQREKVKKEVCLLSYQVVGLTAEVHKQLETNGGPFTPINDVCHVRGKHKRSSIPVESIHRAYLHNILKINATIAVKSY